MRFVHVNKERAIIQLTKGELAGAFIHISDHGVDIKSLPGESKSRIKRLEWGDLMIMNDAISTYDSNEGPLELGFVMNITKAVAKIFGDYE